MENVIKHCNKCQRYGGALTRFKFTLRDDDIYFDHSIYLDIMYIDNKTLLNVLDETNRFQAARWLPNSGSIKVSNALRACWIDAYPEPPDIINHDAGTSYISSEFQHYPLFLELKTKEVPVEAANSMGIVERYHRPLQRAYSIIKEELNSINKPLIL